MIMICKIKMEKTRRAPGCVPPSAFRRELQVEGAARTLHAKVVEGFGVADVVHLDGRGAAHRVAIERPGEPGGVCQLRGDHLLELAQTGALPAPEERVH